jgi:hypothetical protein
MNLIICFALYKEALCCTGRWSPRFVKRAECVEWTVSVWKRTYAAQCPLRVKWEFSIFDVRVITEKITFVLAQSIKQQVYGTEDGRFKNESV